MRTGTRSLTVEAELVAEVLQTGERRLCSRGRFNMVTADVGVRVPAIEASEPMPQDELRMVELVFPDQSNHRHMLFGGHALAAMAKAAFVAATRHCRRTIVLASTRQVTFLAPIQVGEIMELVPKVVATGTRSLQVDVGLWGESLETGERRLAAEGSFTMVAVDDQSDAAPTHSWRCKSRGCGGILGRDRGRVGPAPFGDAGRICRQLHNSVRRIGCDGNGASLAEARGTGTRQAPVLAPAQPFLGRYAQQTLHGLGRKRTRGNDVQPQVQLAKHLGIGIRGPYDTELAAARAL